MQYAAFLLVGVPANVLLHQVRYKRKVLTPLILRAESKTQRWKWRAEGKRGWRMSEDG